MHPTLRFARLFKSVGKNEIAGLVQLFMTLLLRDRDKIA